MKVILFNGPPRSGKDTAADLLASYLQVIDGINVFRYSFARPLKETTHALYGISCEYDGFEYTKDVKQEVFFGLSPREAYIKVSEEMVKPVLTQDHWGKVFINYANRYKSLSGETVIVISDCGFQEEIEPLKAEYGSHNLFLINVQREGTNFKNDSRSYIFDSSIPSYSLSNNGTLVDLSNKMVTIGEIIIGMSDV